MLRFRLAAYYQTLFIVINRLIISSSSLGAYTLLIPFLDLHSDIVAIKIQHILAADQQQSTISLVYVRVSTFVTKSWYHIMID